MPTRRDALKMAGAAALAGTLIPASIAEAGFSGNFDSVLDLSNGGSVVHASGPMTDWEEDEVSGWIIATVTQGVVVASGIAVADPRWSSWSARLAVIGNRRLRPGKAKATAVSVIVNKDGSLETYPWSQAVTLR